VFAIVCVGHLLRVVTGVDVLVGGHQLPVWVNAVACVISGGLSVWMWKLSRPHGDGQTLRLPLLRFLRSCGDAVWGVWIVAGRQPDADPASRGQTNDPGSFVSRLPIDQPKPAPLSRMTLSAAVASNRNSPDTTAIQANKYKGFLLDVRPQT